MSCDGHDALRGDSQRKGRMIRRAAGSGSLLVLPWYAWLGALFSVPLGFVLVVSVWTMHGYTLTAGFTTENYSTALSSGFGQIGLIVSTCAKAMLVVAISALISYPVAYYIVFRLKSPSAAGTILLLVALPFLVGPLIRTIAWSGILGVQGVVNWALTTTGVTSEPVGWLLFSNFAVIVALVYNTYPFMLFTLVLTLETLDQHLAAAARDLGAGALKAFTHVLLPLSAPGLLIGSMLTFIPAVGASLEPELLGGPNGRFISNSISDVFFLALNWPLGSAVAVIFGVAALVSWCILAAAVFLAFRGSFTVGRA